jgi:tripartite-type tricarboxylate transporter receptor subunit TctC
METTLVKRLLRSLLAATCLASSLLAAGEAPVQAQGYPDRPIKLIVGYPPGGPTDTMARVFADLLGARIGQSVVVENRPGAGGNVAATYVARSVPDGYTLLMTTIATHGIVPALYSELPFDPIRDFAPVREVGRAPTILVVTNALPVTSVAELVAYAKANPGKLNFASAGVGTSMHFSGELFRSLAQIDIVHVPYQGSSAAYTDLISGNVQMMFDPQTSIAPLIRGGKVRALAVASAERSTVFPALPTMAESGFPGMAVFNWSGIVAPAKTPPAVIAKLAADLDAISFEDATKARLATVGAVSVKSSPTEFAEFIKTEMARWKKVAQDANIHLD